MDTPVFLFQEIELKFRFELPPALPVLYHAVGARAHQELGGVGVAERGGVEEGGAAAVVDGVGVGAAEGDQRLEAVVVAAGRRAVQSGEAVLRGVMTTSVKP